MAGSDPWLGGTPCTGDELPPRRILDYCAWDHMDAEDFDHELAQLRAEHSHPRPII